MPFSTFFIIPPPGLVSCFLPIWAEMQPILNGGRGTERHVTKCGTLGISWLKTLFLFMFRNIHIYSKTHPLTRSRVYSPSIKCHTNIPFLRVRDRVKKSWKVKPSTTRYDIVTTLKKIACGAMLWSPALLARQLHQERTQVLSSNKEVRKCLALIERISRDWRTEPIIIFNCSI